MTEPLRCDSPSRRALDHLLTEESAEAKAVRECADVHRTQLWKYRTGRGRPDANTIALLARLSRNRVPADGWADDPKPELDRSATEPGFGEERGSKPDFESPDPGQPGVP
jgi:hypothetical protein